MDPLTLAARAFLRAHQAAWQPPPNTGAPVPRLLLVDAPPGPRTAVLKTLRLIEWQPENRRPFSVVLAPFTAPAPYLAAIVKQLDQDAAAVKEGLAEDGLALPALPKPPAFDPERPLAPQDLQPAAARLLAYASDLATHLAAQLDGLQFMDIDIAMAANRVILTTERIVSNNFIRRAPDQTRIPFFTVDAVVEVPYGSAPHECYGVYEPFFDHMDALAEQTKADPEKGIKKYLDDYYYEPKIWSYYLETLGTRDLVDASRRGRSIYND